MSVVSSLHRVNYNDVAPILNNYSELDFYLYGSRLNWSISKLQSNRYVSNYAWNPTNYLLNNYILEYSNLKFFKEHLYTKEETKILSEVFDKLSLSRIQNLLSKQEISSKIFQISGYRMNSVSKINYILENIAGYKKIFNLAVTNQQSILITTE